jgi:hypothetical protein
MDGQRGKTKPQLPKLVNVLVSALTSWLIDKLDLKTWEDNMCNVQWS